MPTGIVNPNATGALAAADLDDMQSQETYIGYDRAQNFISVAARDVAHTYTAPPPYGRHQWGLIGTWTIGAQEAVLDDAGGKIVFRFHARDLHLVLGRSASRSASA